MTTPGITLVCGLPGTGKSFRAAQMAKHHGGLVFSADDFMVDAEGRYAYDPSRLGECHARCLAEVAIYITGDRASSTRGGHAFVANTFSRTFEILPYAAVAQAAGVPLRIVHLFDNGFTDEQLASRNVHGVPVEALAAMRARYKHTTPEDILDLVVNGPRAKR